MSTALYNHRLCPFQNFFVIPGRNSIPIKHDSPFPLSLALICFLSVWIVLSWTSGVDGIRHPVVCDVWLSLAILFLRHIWTITRTSFIPFCG